MLVRLTVSLWPKPLMITNSSLRTPRPWWRSSRRVDSLMYCSWRLPLLDWLTASLRVRLSLSANSPETTMLAVPVELSVRTMPLPVALSEAVMFVAA